jgi:small subunit ribosomal protein S16
MLAMRLQRTGRSGHSQFRLIVQDSRFSPKRGRVSAYLGNYDPHTKELKFDSEKVTQYLQNGAQPSDRVARLLQKEGVKLPTWVKLDEPRERTTRNPDKRRSTRPAGAEAPAPAEPVAEETPSTEAETSEISVEESTAPETEAEETPEEAAAEEPTAPEAPIEPAAEAKPAEETES